MPQMQRVAKSAHQPGMANVHVDVPLTNVSIAYMQDPANFMAGRAFPMVPVDKASGKYFEYDRTYFFRNEVKKRAPGTPAARLGYGVSTSSYSCDRDSIAKDIPDPVRDNQDAPLDQDRDATNIVTAQLMLNAEIQWAAKYFATSVWTGSTTAGDITPGVLWDDAASTPVEDIRTQKRSVLKNTGKVPNKGVLGAKLFDNLCDHPDILDRIKYAAGPGNPAIANEQTLAQVLGLEEILVCRAVQNSAQEGIAGSYSFIQDPESMLLCYAPAQPGLQVPSAGYMFTWKGAGNPFGVQIKTYRRAEEFESDSVEGNFWYDFKKVSAALGVFFSNAVAA